MAASTTQLEKLRAEVKKLRSENTSLKRQLRKFTGPSKRSRRKQRFATIRRAARRNAMTETDAMALALEAEHAPNH